MAITSSVPDISAKGVPARSWVGVLASLVFGLWTHHCSEQSCVNDRWLTVAHVVCVERGVQSNL